MLIVLKNPYILTARAKGITDQAVRYQHAGRNALLPVITQTGIQLGRMISGVIFIEIVFAYPGLGYLTYEALLARDYPVIQGVLLVVAVFVLIANFLVDLSYSKLDPRIRYAH